MGLRTASLVAAALVLVVGCLAASPADAATPVQLSSFRLALADGCCPEPCCPEPCIRYRTRGCHRCCDPCAPSIQTCLKVTNPCTGCTTEVPVCLPACCQGEPEVCCTKGIFCRDVVWYDWCCGFSVKVTFQRCGDILVTYVGR